MLTRTPGPRTPCRVEFIEATGRWHVIRRQGGGMKTVDSFRTEGAAKRRCEAENARTK